MVTNCNVGENAMSTIRYLVYQLQKPYRQAAQHLFPGCPRLRGAPADELGSYTVNFREDTPREADKWDVCAWCWRRRPAEGVPMSMVLPVRVEP